MHKVFFVGHLLEVMCNLLYWNRSVQTEAGQKLWGRRRCRYFVFDPTTKLFAPSKFCAYRPLPLEPTTGAAFAARHDTPAASASFRAVALSCFRDSLNPMRLG